VRAQRAALEPLGSARELTTVFWDRLRVAEPQAAAVLRLSRLPSDFARTWDDARKMVEPWSGAYCHGDAARGVVRCVFPLEAADGDRTIGLTTVAFDGTRIFERLPPAAWTRVPSSLRSPLERRIKSAFDPGRVLNPGILGELQ
jgi:FAD/FMN-containing dehydrogenase